MNTLTSLFAITLLLVSSSAWAEADSSADLRYCLDLKSNEEIAKCAGEISPGNKGKPFSKETVDKILEKQKASAPPGTKESSGTSATAGKKHGENAAPKSAESNAN